MDLADWDEASCQKVRSLIDPLRHQIEPEQDNRDLWAETMKEAIRLFENLFQAQGTQLTESHDTTEEDDDEEQDEEFIIEP